MQGNDRDQPMMNSNQGCAERLVEGELWLQVEGTKLRAYELVGASVDTTRGPLLRSSQGLRYSEPPAQTTAPRTPTRAGRLSRGFRVEYAIGDEHPQNAARPSAPLRRRICIIRREPAPAEKRRTVWM